MEIIDKLVYALDHYARAAALALAAYGVGSLMLARLFSTTALLRLERTALAVTVGLALLALLVLALGVAGQFNAVALGVTVGGAAALGIYRLLRRPVAPVLLVDESARWRRVPLFVWLAAFVALLPFILRPLNPPFEWDELMYHLPYVRFWAESGGLAIDERLRYPYFPYGYHMLYVVAYVLGTDVLTHLVHGLAGWLTALLICCVAVRLYGVAVALVGAVLFIASVGAYQFSSAYIDLALTLYVSASQCALLLGHRSGGRAGWFYLSGLFIGMAAAIKYQAAIFGLLWLVLLLVVARRAKVLAVSIVVATGAGGYWYVRNFVMTGDPVHPLGGSLFGFHLWDATDLRGQLTDVGKAIELPFALLWVPALGLLPHWRRLDRMTKLLFAVTGYGVLSWIATSGHSRYLMPAFPALCLLSALASVRLTQAVVDSAVFGRLRGALPAPLRTALPIVFVSLVAVAFLPQTRKAWDRIAVDQAERDQVMAPRLTAYSVLRDLAREPSTRLVQIGFEGQLYYAPPGTVGDHFGRYRYRTIYGMAGQPAVLANWFRAHGFNTLLINDAPNAHAGLRFPESMAEHFDLVQQTEHYRLYRLRGSSAR